MKEARTKKRRQIGWSQLVAIGFLLLIGVGTLLLSLPISSANGSFTSPLDAGFTAVSASCVTGLITLDTATHWNTFGHVVILTMIQIGGIGFMTMAVLISFLFKRAVTPKERMMVAQSYSLTSFNSITELIKRIIFGTLIIEGVGAAILCIRFIPAFGVGDGIFKSVFHSISAFCNAGFDIIGIGNPEISSMAYYAKDPLINITLTMLIILGGIGFLVWSEVINFARGKQKLSVYSKFVIAITAVLLSLGAILFALFEWNNDATIGSFSISEKIVTSLFQSASWRTAGFATVENAAFNEGSQFLGMVLMFIGGASGSTAGGVKVATVGIVVLAVWCVARGKKNTVVFRRTITENSFLRATSVIVVQLTAIALGAIIINVADNFTMNQILYEVISGVSTVGVSLGITSLLSPISKITIMFLMYFGRVGILTLTFALLNNQSSKDDHIRYPDANMLIG